MEKKIGVTSTFLAPVWIFTMLKALVDYLMMNQILVCDKKSWEDFKQSLLRKCTVFENHRKSLIQQCERSEQRLHFEWTKVN